MSISGGFFLLNMIVPRYNTSMDKKNFTKWLVSLIFFILLVHSLALKFYWYFTIWWLDMFVHFLGGFWIGLVALWFFSKKFKFLTESKAFIGIILKILFFVLLVGIGWEVFEILVNDVIAKDSFDYLDILSDLFFDLVGGAFVTLFFFKKIMLQSKDGLEFPKKGRS
ncbi:MAG: hypothetical protein US18_C0027G0007 [Parcubacteria group bacterium GW2011_GWB1_36_5]|nr:MAG: hypothetical protein US18_C0027G0007 [Parcubacteria group bacterium GW2011_GWB1_36_5]